VFVTVLMIVTLTLLRVAALAGVVLMIMLGPMSIVLLMPALGTLAVAHLAIHALFAIAAATTATAPPTAATRTAAARPIALGTYRQAFRRWLALDARCFTRRPFTRWPFTRRFGVSRFFAPGLITARVIATR
jgi:hypothetical protein